MITRAKLGSEVQGSVVLFCFSFISSVLTCVKKFQKFDLKKHIYFEFSFGFIWDNSHGTDG